MAFKDYTFVEHQIFQDFVFQAGKCLERRDRLHTIGQVPAIGGNETYVDQSWVYIDDGADFFTDAA